MTYLIYQQSTGQVIQITEQEPTNIADGLLVAQSDAFSVGDEFTYYIVVNSVEDGVVTSHAAVRQAPAIQDILQRLAESEQENTELKLALAEMAEAHELEKTEMQLAIAELAELVAGGEA